jgi:hypothetical protein
MCWSEQTCYSACGHYVRQTYYCPFQQDSYRTESDWLSECTMHDVQPARQETGKCGRCELHSRSLPPGDGYDDDGSGDDAWVPQREVVGDTAVERDGAAHSDGGSIPGTTILGDLWSDGVATPPTQDMSLDIHPGLCRRQSSAASSEYCSSDSSESSASFMKSLRTRLRRISMPAAYSYPRLHIIFRGSLRTKISREGSKGSRIRDRKRDMIMAERFRVSCAEAREMRQLGRA